MSAAGIPRHIARWGSTACRRRILGKILSRETRRQQSQQAELDSTENTLLRKAKRPQFRKISPYQGPPKLVIGRTPASFKNFASDHPITLRDSCQCTKCVDPSSHQREFSFADIPQTIQAKDIAYKADRKQWTVTWTDDIPGYEDHVSKFPQAVVDQLLHDEPVGMGNGRTVSLWNKEVFAAETKDIVYDDLLNDDYTLHKVLWLISCHGLVFISNVPKDETAVIKLVTRLTGHFRNTFYGQSWDVRSVPKAKNVAYTSKVLDFHMDLLYMKEPPGLQLLHCLENTCTGGESEFADTFRAIDQLYFSDPEQVEFLASRNKIRYGYNNDPHFYSDDKEVIKLKSKNKKFKRHEPDTFFRHCKRGKASENLRFLKNIDCVYWSPPFVNSIAAEKHVEFGENDSKKRLLAATAAFAKLLRKPENVFEAKLPAGTCAVFDNLRVVHARKAFDVNSGNRWLKGAYGDRQDLRSMTIKHVWNTKSQVAP